MLYFKEMKGQIVLSPKTKVDRSTTRNRGVEPRLVGSEAVLYRLRRDYAAKGGLSGSLGTRDNTEPVLRHKAKRIAPQRKSEVSPGQKEAPGPLLSLSVERSKTEGKEPMQSSSFLTRETVHKASVSRQFASSQVKLTTIKLGGDLPISTQSAGQQILEQQLKTWMSYQQDFSPRKKLERINPTAYTRTEITAPLCTKPPQSQTKRERRQRSYELLPETDRIQYSKPEDRLATQLLSSPVLTHNPLSGFPKPPPLKQTSKKRRLSPEPSTDKGQPFPAELPSPPSDLPAYRFPRLRKVSRPPAHSLPGYRLAVDYNLYRFVYKHKDRVTHPISD